MPPATRSLRAPILRVTSILLPGSILRVVSIFLPGSDLLASVLLLGSMLLLAPSALAQPLTVARIIDGDTFELSDGRHVRLIGIDTPEVHPSAKLRRDAERTARDAALIQALGEEASRHAALLALGQMVELEFDPANAAIDHTDRYGRSLAYVWVLDTGMVRSFCVNARMVSDGFANAYTRYPFARMDEYRAYEREAREARRGLWNAEATGAGVSLIAPANQGSPR